MVGKKDKTVTELKLEVEMLRYEIDLLRMKLQALEKYHTPLQPIQVPPMTVPDPWWQQKWTLPQTWVTISPNTLPKPLDGIYLCDGKNYNS